MSMTNGVAHGVEIYSKKLSELIVEQPPYIYIHLYLKKVKLLSFYRLFWNFFISSEKISILSDNKKHSNFVMILK